MWRVNYLLKCFFTLILNIITELQHFCDCIKSIFPDCIKHDYYEGYDPEEDLYELERRLILKSIQERRDGWNSDLHPLDTSWDEHYKQQEAQIQRWCEKNPGKDPFMPEYPFN